MSAETDFLNHFIQLRRAMSNGTSGDLDLGIEVTVVEANRGNLVATKRIPADPHRPGQKSYARAISSEAYDATIGIHIARSGSFEPVRIPAGLKFPFLTGIVRYFAYPTDGGDWSLATPFDHNSDTAIRTIEVSLIPFYSTLTGVHPVPPDGNVHVRVTYENDEIAILENVRLDPASRQLLATGQPLAQSDQASLWVIAFFPTRATPG